MKILQSMYDEYRKPSRIIKKEGLQVLLKKTRKLIDEQSQEFSSLQIENTNDYDSNEELIFQLLTSIKKNIEEYRKYEKKSKKYEKYIKYKTKYLNMKKRLRNLFQSESDREIQRLGVKTYIITTKNKLVRELKNLQKVILDGNLDFVYDQIQDVLHIITDLRKHTPNHDEVETETIDFDPIEDYHKDSKASDKQSKLKAQESDHNLKLKANDETETIAFDPIEDYQRKDSIMKAKLKAQDSTKLKTIDDEVKQLKYNSSQTHKPWKP